MGWSIDQIPDQMGKTIVVTGANTGIGFATAKALAAKGATVVLACRSLDKGHAALSALKRELPAANVVLEQLDLGSLASVQAFAESIARQYARLDVLINNAGVATPPFGRTADGFEIQFGTNVLGHFALTGHLLPLLAAAPKARVVSLSSLAHKFGKIDFNNLNAERGYDKVAAYGQSKLADLMFAYELQRRLQKAGASTISVAVHPGVTGSELFRHSGFFNLGAKLVAQTSEQGAWPSLMAATAPEIKGGEYIGPGGLLAIKGLPTIQKSNARSHDTQVAAKLWDVSQTLTGVAYL